MLYERGRVNLLRFDLVRSASLFVERGGGGSSQTELVRTNNHFINGDPHVREKTEDLNR